MWVIGWIEAGSNMFSWVLQMAFNAAWKHWLGDQGGA